MASNDKIVTKRPPQVSVEGMERVIQQVYDDINDIVRAVNSHLANLGDVEGKTGDIKILNNDVNSYELRAKTKDGWVKTDLSFVDKEN